MDTLPRTVRLKNPTAIITPMISQEEADRGLRRSSGLRFQMFAVEVRSFLPDDQDDRRDLAR
jgi:hypothetical protein